ncbi:methionine--tRNA ligase [Candidatus Micrarchaeota archaeon]|nr:methionine--tRNA ligase [Candidatus Micrarchaeota archaeon]
MKILITSALPYVNNDLHLGHMIGSLLPADVFARYMRMKGHDVMFICGNDEYGTATEIAAHKEEISPKELCDKYHEIHKKVIKWWGVSTEKFGRTTTKEHTEITQNIFMGLYKNKYIIEREIEQPIDPETGTALADRYIEGTCPECNVGGARGDQCESCGKLLSPKDLINPISKISGKKPIFKKTKHLFLDLPSLQPKLFEWHEQRIGNWNNLAKSITKGWAKEELHERDITRNIKWGIPVPLEGYDDLVIYVWFDAPIGYISITQTYTKDWDKWWLCPDEVKYYQFMGKDNVPFHSIIFPSILIGDNKNWKTVDVLHAMDYLNFEGKKFSKSKNIGVFCTQAMQYPFPTDYWRFYLFSIAPENGDTSFKWDEFVERVNKELIDNVGNLVRRLATMTSRYGPVTPEPDETFIKQINALVEQYSTHMDEREFKKSLSVVLELSAKTNAYFQEQKPWDKMKENKQACNKIFYSIGYAIQRIATMLSPFTPKISLDIVNQFGFVLGYGLVSEFQVYQVVFMLDKMEVPKEKGIIVKVGKIEKIEKHPEAEKLYIETVNMGNKNITIVSGLVPYYKEEELLGKKILVVENLKPAKLRGVVSEGMLLAADDGASVEVLFTEEEIGTKTVLPHNTQKDQITIEELFEHKLTVKDNQVYFDGKELVIGKLVKTSKIKEGEVR